ncbi:hypothetical protein PG985_014727 [Apiospora marii]|uniref:uncharacterized protein n=1 Tax=Apiospora marii TaxID=335849 RepID=UPI00313238FB
MAEQSNSSALLNPQYNVGGWSKARLIICCDGTGNSEYLGSEKSPLTNVSRIARAINQWDDTQPIRQVVLYLRGIGTDENPDLWDSTNSMKQLTGTGLKSLIMEAYTFLSHNWTAYERQKKWSKMIKLIPPWEQGAEESDDIILIGFSRGAFAMRCLADFITRYGLLGKKELSKLPKLIERWEKEGNQVEQGNEETSGEKGREVEIKVCALWDTVDSVGTNMFNPIRPGPFAFVCSDLLGNIEHAFQALALHERRAHFNPLVWERVPDSTGNTTLKQCWFAGYHSDIGGGNYKGALSHFALVWMIAKLDPFVSISKKDLWTEKITAWTLPGGNELGVQDSKSGKYRFQIKDFHRWPRYLLKNKNGVLDNPELIDSHDNEEQQIHFSAGYLQHRKALKRFPPFQRFNPSEDNIAAVLQRRNGRKWVLSKPGPTSWFSGRRYHERQSSTYSVEEQYLSLTGKEKEILEDWVAFQHGNDLKESTLSGGSRFNDRESLESTDKSKCILAELKEYLES